MTRVKSGEEKSLHLLFSCCLVVRDVSSYGSQLHLQEKKLTNHLLPRQEVRMAISDWRQDRIFYTASNTIYIVYYNLYTVQWILYILKWKFKPVQCKLYIVHFNLYTVHCALKILHCTLYTVHCTSYIVHCKLYTIHYALYLIH